MYLVIVLQEFGVTLPRRLGVIDTIVTVLIGV